MRVNDDGNRDLVNADGVHFRIRNIHLFTSAVHSHKFNGTVLIDEFAFSINAGCFYSVYSLFLRGSWNDLIIVRHRLHCNLDYGETCIADEIFFDGHKLSMTLSS